MHQTTCPGTCNNAWRRAETVREETGTEHHLTPTWGQPVQCAGCVERARQQLLEIPELLAAATLEATARPCSASAVSINTRDSKAAPQLPGEPSRFLFEEIVEQMEELEANVLVLRRIRQADDIPTRLAGIREGRWAADRVRILEAHLDWMMQKHPAAGESHGRGNANPGAQIRGWHAALQHFIKAHPQHDVRKLAPCPRCKGPYLAESRDLRLVDDRPYIECRDPDCQRILTGAEYDEYVKGLASGISRAA